MVGSREVTQGNGSRVGLKIRLHTEAGIGAISLCILANSSELILVMRIELNFFLFLLLFLFLGWLLLNDHWRLLCLFFVHYVPLSHEEILGAEILLHFLNSFWGQQLGSHSSVLSEIVTIEIFPQILKVGCSIVFIEFWQPILFNFSQIALTKPRQKFFELIARRFIQHIAFFAIHSGKLWGEDLSVTNADARGDINNSLGSTKLELGCRFGCHI